MTSFVTHKAETVASGGLSFLEGLRWRDGRVHASDFFTNRVIAFDPRDGSVETLFSIDDIPSGLGWTVDGDLIVSSMVQRKLLRWDGSSLSVYADLWDHAPWHTNDIVVDAEGRTYVGNVGWDESTDRVIRSTNLHRVDPDGSIHEVADGLVCPNGMAITADGKTLLVAETFAARITAFDRASDGSLSNQRVWASFSDEPFETLTDARESGAVLPDGIAVDASDTLWVGDCVGSAAIRIAEGGEVLERVPSGDQATFAMVLGGEDRRTLYVCTAVPYPGDASAVHGAELRACRVEVPGAGLP
jgi:sugar lactone lactonase YvrE